uniref:NADH dehydrogenase [ubiquinone] 1 beta subcomplex subunit 4 n=1 Tax=Salvator merianae TaxID=96440 RepID=A0A8D0BJI1_SALMN
MAAPFSSKGGYRPAPLASLPPELNPAEYDASPEKRRADAERLAIRSKLKREFLVQLNNPLRAERIDDPALTRWIYAKMYLPINTSRPTPKSSLLGIVGGIGPLVFWFYVIKKCKDNRDKLIEEGKYERPFRLA